MDYISQSCKHVITEGQAYRANLAIQNSLDPYLVCPDCQPSQDGDFNGDGGFNVVDMSLFNSVFNCSEGDDCYDSFYDYDCNGSINILDFSNYAALFPAVMFFNQYGERVRPDASGLVIGVNQFGYVSKTFNP